MKVKLLICFFLLLKINFTAGQSFDSLRISGQVFSKLTKLPIDNGYIVINDKMGTITNQNGYFILSNIKSGKVRVSFKSLDFSGKDTIIFLTQSIDDFKWFILSDCKRYNAERALESIKNDNLTLLLQGGIAPVTFRNDKKFSERYGVKFEDFGDLIVEYRDCMIIYNQIIFDYLDKKFGKKWRKKIRKDIPGL